MKRIWMDEKEKYEDLIRRIKSSNAEAFEEVFKSYHDELYNFLVYKIGDSQTAEDILQDVFIKLWENRHQLKTNLSIKAYLYTIAKNLALNYFRHKKVILKFQQEIEMSSSQDQSPSPQSVLEFEEFSSKLFEVLENLPEQQRLIFMMSRQSNLSHKDISERLNLSIKTVETHIGRALKTLAKSLKPDDLG